MDKFAYFWKITWEHDIRGCMFYNGAADVDFKYKFLAYEYKQTEIIYVPSNKVITYMMTGKYYV